MINIYSKTIIYSLYSQPVPYAEFTETPRVDPVNYYSILGVLRLLPEGLNLEEVYQYYLAEIDKASSAPRIVNPLEIQGAMRTHSCGSCGGGKVK